MMSYGYWTDNGNREYHRVEIDDGGVLRRRGPHALLSLLI